METYRSCVYMVLDELKLDSDDSRIEVEHIIFLLNKYRAILTKQRYGKIKKDVPLEYYQIKELGKLSLSPNNTDVRRTFFFEDPIPSILNLHGILLETSISYSTQAEGDYTVNNIDINFISPDRFKYLGENKWLSSMPYATIGYDHRLYISSTVDFLKDKTFRIQAIFETPSDFENTTDGKLDMYFPIEHALLQPIIDLVVKELSNFLYLPKDDENNSADDLSISMSAYRPAKSRANTTIEE